MVAQGKAVVTEANSTWGIVTPEEDTVGGQEILTLYKNNVKIKISWYLFNNRWWLGTWIVLGRSTMPQKDLFQPLRHASFFGYVFIICIIKKTAQL
jgi:hypothetical protein